MKEQGEQERAHVNNARNGGRQQQMPLDERKQQITEWSQRDWVVYRISSSVFVEEQRGKFELDVL